MGKDFWVILRWLSLQLWLGSKDAEEQDLLLVCARLLQ